MRNFATCLSTVLITGLLICVYFLSTNHKNDLRRETSNGRQGSELLSEHDVAHNFVFNFERSIPDRPSFKRFDVPTREGRGWRWAAVAFMSYHYSFYSTVNWHIYEFGVAGGASIASIRDAFNHHNLHQPHIWGFDSFAGIPSEASGVSRPAGWTQGTYDSSKNHPLSTWECRKGKGAANAGGEHCVPTGSGRRVSIDDQISYMRTVHQFPPSKVAFFPGYYNESLQAGLVQDAGLRPAMFIDIDCDLYISTFQALDFMFANNLAVAGTLIGYDDFCLTQLGTAGESRAHNEIAVKYGVTFKCVVGGCSDEMMRPGPGVYYNLKSSKMHNPVFLVMAVSGASSSNGYENGYPEKCVQQSKFWEQVQ